ncbi:ATP-binding protein [Desulfobulbus sp.]|uniref:hybrid sensor histidine kinase/response regulator n=1 Tax=Desulfobulbus sp. TaxID=895 RepID=UPI0027BAF0B9|nr:ATP-binding protein [Desulfobulbus sp.]
MNKRLLITGCLLFLPPQAAQAAQDAAVSVAAAPALYGSLAVLLVVAGGLWTRLRRCEREKQDALGRWRLMRQIVEHAPLPIVEVDGGLRVVEANPAACAAYGKDTLIGCSLLELEPELADERAAATMQSTDQAAPATDLSGRNGAIGARGVLNWLVVDDQSLGLWFGSPSTAGLQAATAAGALSLAEESANRMKSEFIANINHEVRTPMNAIIGYAEMLANSALGPKEKRFVAIIHKSSMALVSIFNDIMELSKIDSGRLQIMVSSIRLPPIINEVQGLFNDLAEEKGIHLYCRIAKNLPQSFILDGVRLKQILQNLVSNAIKFTTEGMVELTVDGEPSAAPDGGYDLRFTVQDSGIGIPVVDQEKIFELFRQREDTIAKQYGGVGLGLTLCSRLTTMMGGRIDLFSNEGQGARFTVYLNGIQLAEHPPSEQSAPLCGIVTAREQELTILVVDDVDLIKDVFVDFFQDSPYRVLTANNGDEAMSLALVEHPDLIFMDLNLSGTNGRSITEQLRQNPETSAIPVVVMTGEMLEEEDYKPLFDDFLQKPFRLEVLKEIVARYAKVASVSEPQPPDGDDLADEEHALSACVAGVWNEDLEQLRCQAVRSGSLTDAASLGAAIGQHGKTEQQPVLTALGRDLFLFANEPNILGVDRLLAKLSRAVNRKNS